MFCFWLVSVLFFFFLSVLFLGLRYVCSSSWGVVFCFYCFLFFVCVLSALNLNAGFRYSEVFAVFWLVVRLLICLFYFFCVLFS